MDLLIFGLTLIGFGAFSTYLLATSLPEKVFLAASKHGLFFSVGEQTVHGDDTKFMANELRERKQKPQSAASAFR